MILCEESGLGKVFFDNAYTNLVGIPAYIWSHEWSTIMAWVFIVLLSVCLPLSVVYIIWKECTR